MDEINLSEMQSVTINYQAFPVSPIVRLFRPTVYKSDSGFYCFIGTVGELGIIGRGNTFESAIEDWEKHFNNEISSGTNDERLLQVIKEKLNTGDGA